MKNLCVLTNGVRRYNNDGVCCTYIRSWGFNEHEFLVEYDTPLLEDEFMMFDLSDIRKLLRESGGNYDGIRFKLHDEDPNLYDQEYPHIALFH